MGAILETDKAKYVRSTAVVSRLIADETLVVPIRSGVGDLDSIYSFNALGSDLWALLEKEISLEEMCAWVTKHYEVAEEQALGDIREFVGELVGTGLVTSIATSPAR
jgi:hypothetical protein